MAIIKNLQMINAGEGVEKRVPPTLLVGKKVGTVTMENTMEDPQETKERATIWSNNPTPGHISGENYNSKRYMHPSVHFSIIYNSQDTAAT